MYGYSWTSRTHTTVVYAYNFRFNNSGVFPSTYHDNRYYGYPLRCLSTVLDMKEATLTKTKTKYAQANLTKYLPVK